MATLTNTKIKDTYDGLLKTTDNDVIGASEKVITDGLGNASVLSIGTASASFSSDIEVNGLTIGLGSGSIATNTALGSDALFSNTSGSGNVSVGQGSMRSNTVGLGNVAVGKDALRLNTTGNYNVAIGYTSLYSNTTGAFNTAIGIASLYENTEGQNNTAVGHYSANSNTTGLYNTALGSAALFANETSGNNTALGYYALRNNTAANNTAVGSGALADNTTGGVNTAVGKDALNSNTTGGGNTAIGYQALQVQTAQSSNTAIGHLALKNNVAPSNTAVGSQALTANTTGQNNTAVGSSALQSNVDGIWNTALGYGAGYNKTGGNSNIYIGYQAIGGAVDSTNEIVIGKGATGNGSNTATYGNSSITHHYFEGDIVLTDGSNPVLSVQDTLGGSSFLKLLAGDTGTSNIYLGDDSDENAGAIVYDHSDNSMSFRTNGFLEKMSIDSSGNVSMVNDLSVSGNLAVSGISTFSDNLKVKATSDNYSVNVGSTSDSDNTVNIISSTSGTNRLLFSDSNNGQGGFLYNHTSDYLSFIANDSERMRIDSSGNVGIGTSNANLSSSDTALTVNSASNSNAAIEISDGGTLAGVLYGKSSQQVGLWAVPNIYMTFATNNTERMRIDSSGRVGIGTDSPTYPMQLTGAGDTTFGIEAGATSLASLNLGNSTNLADGGIRYDNSTDALIFRANNAEKMRIDSSGNVGIGTSDPDTMLHISDSLGNAVIRLERNDTAIVNGDTYGAIEFEGQDANAGASGVRGSIKGEAEASNGQLSLVFSTASGNSANTERMRITSGGDVLIGTQTVLQSGEKLAVDSSSIQTSVIKNSSGYALNWVQKLWQNSTSGDNRFLEFTTESTITGRGYIDYNRGAGVVRYNTTSDANFKNIIGDSDKQESVQILESTRIREYSWKEDETNKKQVGVIAQELYETFKGAVSKGSPQEDFGSEDYKYWAVDKTAFTFHLVAGWQEHQRMIKEQQEIINDLKARIETLENN